MERIAPGQAPLDLAETTIQITLFTPLGYPLGPFPFASPKAASGFARCWLDMHPENRALSQLVDTPGAPGKTSDIPLGLVTDIRV